MTEERAITREVERRRLKVARRHIDAAGALIWAASQDYREAGKGPYEALETIARALAEIMEVLDAALGEI